MKGINTSQDYDEGVETAKPVETSVPTAIDEVNLERASKADLAEETKRRNAEASEIDAIRGQLGIFKETDKEGKESDEAIESKYNEFQETLQHTIKTIESSELTQVGVDLYSDQPMSPQDLKYIIDTKTALDPTGSRRIRVVIVNREHWTKLNETKLGQENLGMDFDGSSLAISAAPTGHSSLVVVPSDEVFTTQTRYGEAYRQDPEMKKLIEADPRQTYSNIFLRNILAHEMSHVYQFSDKTNKGVLKKEVHTPSDLNEFLACCHGYLHMNKSAQQVYVDAFLGASARAAAAFPKSGEGEDNRPYVIRQAERNVKAKELVNALGAEKTANLLNLLTEVAQANNDRTYQVQNAVSQYVTGGKTYAELLQLIDTDKTVHFR